MRDLKNWNTIWDDNIRPGQVLYLADPYDSFVKEIASKFSKHELTGRNPKISLDRLSDEMVAQHGGLFREKHQVEIQLEFRERPEEFMSSELVSGHQELNIRRASGVSLAGGNVYGNNLDQDHISDEAKLMSENFREKHIKQNMPTCSNCLNPATINHNLPTLWGRSTYPGGDNPRSYNGKYNYSYAPSHLSEYPAIGHDRRYDNLGTAGFIGLSTDTRAIGADWEFVKEELQIATMSYHDPLDRGSAAILAFGLGFVASFKTVYQLSKGPTGYLEIILWYNISNQGVTNSPSKHIH